MADDGGHLMPHAIVLPSFARTSAPGRNLMLVLLSIAIVGGFANVHLCLEQVLALPKTSVAWTSDSTPGSMVHARIGVRLRHVRAHSANRNLVVENVHLHSLEALLSILLLLRNVWTDLASNNICRIAFHGMCSHTKRTHVCHIGNVILRPCTLSTQGGQDLGNERTR